MRKRLARTFLRLATPLAGFRRVPLVGPCLGWAAAKLVPRDARTWVQIQRGPAKGIWLHLNPRTGHDYFTADIEPEVQAVLQKYLRPGMTFYDVGANIGFFSLLAARLVGAQGRVVAFEADPEVVRRLRENAARNSATGITVEHRAVWSSAGTVVFARANPGASPDRGLGHVMANQARETAAQMLRIQAVTLDQYAASFGSAQFIKCDVEGGEVEVFRGASTLLSEEKPGILCEMHGEENRRVLLQVFANLGYRCEPCGKNHLLALFSQQLEC